MKQVVVTGIGLISALGDLTSTWEALLQGKSAIAFKQPFPQLDPLPLASVDSSPADLTKLTQTIVTEALRDAQLEPPLPNCGVVVGSSRGFQSVLEELITQPQKTDFSAHLPFHCSLIAREIVGSQSYVFSPMAACATGLVAIARAVELIKMGECEQVLVGAVESPITPLTVAAFKKIGALAETGCYPFDRKREGLVLGEGGAVLLLETKELAKKRGVKIYGEILGFGLSCDAQNLTAPTLSGAGGKKAIENCLKSSQLKAQDIQLIHAHGTSTILNDTMEAKIIKSLFPPSVWVTSTKGATGHTLGASGALGLAFILKALQTQVIPPCVGLREPDFNLNFVKEMTKTPINQALCLSFGFGGINSVISVKLESKNHLKI